MSKVYFAEVAVLQQYPFLAHCRLRRKVSCYMTLPFARSIKLGRFTATHSDMVKRALTRRQNVEYIAEQITADTKQMTSALHSFNVSVN